VYGVIHSDSGSQKGLSCGHVEERCWDLAVFFWGERETQNARSVFSQNAMVCSS